MIKLELHFVVRHQSRTMIYSKKEVRAKILDGWTWHEWEGATMVAMIWQEFPDEKSAIAARAAQEKAFREVHRGFPYFIKVYRT